MSAVDRKNRLELLVRQYQEFKSAGKLDLTSEETIRTWLNQLLEIFNWDVRDTSQVLQEKVLSASEKEKLKAIGSQNSRPDYTLKIAAQKLSFLDAKDISVRIETDKVAAFQIKSYGWSILAPCAFISNFEEFAIYDCTYAPTPHQDASLGRLYFKIDDFVTNFDTLDKHLLKENIYNGKLGELYSKTLTDNRQISKVTPDQKFAELLSAFRLTLAANIYHQNAAYLNGNLENLSYIVQIIINRIIFIRVCEARKIEEEGLLLEFKRKGFWNEFKNSSYVKFYDRYDGPLFDRIASVHAIQVSDETFDGLLQNLYYPSPYRFDVIPTKLLSDIYELFLARKLVLDGSDVKDELKSEYLKTKGAVSTPQYIVQEIIRRTIIREDLLNGGIENLLQTRVLDIACGSGVFAIETYDYLEDVFVELYLKDKNPAFSIYFLETESGVITNLAGRKAIMDNCIFGVDIDPEAVEVTKVSLSFKVVDTMDNLESYHQMGIFGSRILNGIGNNIKCGNSLVGRDILEVHPTMHDDEQQMLQTNIFDWESEQGFQSVFDQKQGFDFIVGNPPYVEVKNYKVELPKMHEYIKLKYPSAKNGKVDLAIPFIERALQLLNPNGRMGYIIQKRFFKTEYGRKIREIISSSKLLSSILDIEATNVFKGRMTYVALLTLDRKSPEAFSYKNFSSPPELLPSDLRSSNTPLSNPEQYVTIPSMAISANPWSFSDSELIAIRTRLLAGGTFGDYATVKVGVQVLWDRAYHIRPISIEDGMVRGKSHLEPDFKIELAACRPMICNENFYPYRKEDADVYVIFPYDVIDGKVRQIPFNEYTERYPLAAAYLERNKSLIQDNVETLPYKYPKKFTPEHWHLFTRANNHGDVYPKIMVPMTALDTFASVCFSEITYCDNANVFFIKAPETTPEEIYALSAMINSSVFSVLARSIAMPQSNGYFKFNKQFLEPVPFPVSAFRGSSMEKTKLSETAKKIELLQQRYIKASPNQQSSLRLQIDIQWQILDETVCGLYGLSESEIMFFNQKGRNSDRVDILK